MYIYGEQRKQSQKKNPKYLFTVEIHHSFCYSFNGGIVTEDDQMIEKHFSSLFFIFDK